MKKVAGIVLGAVLFGAVAGASMVGVNVAAQKVGIAYQSDSGAQAVTPETTAAATGQVGFRGSQRVDGKLILPEAIKTLQMK